MNLYTGLPWWIVRNEFVDMSNPVDQDITVDVAIIGGGITGSLVAHKLCSEGMRCAVVDKRSIGTGSSAASTALLQYEIDIPLHKMMDITGETVAVRAYLDCLEAIGKLENIIRDSGVDGSFENVPSLYLASNRKGVEIVHREYETRKKFGFPTQLLDRRTIHRMFGIKAPCALYNDVSAQIDVYRTATGLLEYDMRNNGLAVFPHTEITKWKRSADHYTLQTRSGHKIKCDYLVVATGFEAGPFLPEKLMDLTSTFAIISEPVPGGKLWHKKSLIWETREPYLYIRTSGDRIIVGRG